METDVNSKLIVWPDGPLKASDSSLVPIQA